MQRCCSIYSEGCIYSESVSNIHGVSPIARVLGSKNQGVEMGVAPFTVSPSDLLERFLLLDLVTLCPVEPEILVPEGGVLPPGGTSMIPLNWELRLPLSHFELLMPLN